MKKGGGGVAGHAAEELGGAARDMTVDLGSSHPFLWEYLPGVPAERLEMRSP